MRPSPIGQRTSRENRGPEFAQQASVPPTGANGGSLRSQSIVTRLLAGGAGCSSPLGIARQKILTARMLVAPDDSNRPAINAAIQRRSIRAAFLRTPSGTQPESLEGGHA